jgi:hypothetical protein
MAVSPVGCGVQHCAAPLPVGETGGSKGKKNHGRFAAEKRKVHALALKISNGLKAVFLTRKPLFF